MRPAMCPWQWMSTPLHSPGAEVLFQDGFHREDVQPWHGDDNWELSDPNFNGFRLYAHRIYQPSGSSTVNYIKCKRPFERPYCVILPITKWVGSICVNYVDPDNYNEIRWQGELGKTVSFLLYEWTSGVGTRVGTGYARNEPWYESNYTLRPSATELVVCVTEYGVSTACMFMPKRWFMKKGVLTTRTSDTEGVITLGEDHGFDDDRVDLRWDGGTRTNVESVTSTETAVISDGTGDVLPAVDTPMFVELCRSYYRPYYAAGAATPYYQRPWVSDYFAVKEMGYPLELPSIAVVRPGTTANRRCPVTAVSDLVDYPSDWVFGGAREAPLLVDATVPTPINGTCGATCQLFAGEHLLHARSQKGWTKWLDASCGLDHPRLELVLDGAVAELSLYTYHDYNPTALWRAPWVMPSPCETWEDWPPIDIDLDYASGNYYHCDFRGTTARVTSRPFREVV